VDREGACAGDLANAAPAGDAAARALFEHAVRSEMVLGLLESRLRGAGTAADAGDDPDAGDAAYLAAPAAFDAPPCAPAATLVDAGGRGVMMDWEAPLMTAHAHVAARAGAPALNIGHGLGLYDRALAEKLAATSPSSSPLPPAAHVICEAHPDVLARMDAEGWPARASIVRGRWQDALADGRLAAAGPYASIFFDTFGDGDAGLDAFFAALPALLARPHGVASFFCGIAADNPFFHAVACECAVLKLARLGFDTRYVTLPLPASATADATWAGVGNKYWQLGAYSLPIITWREEEEEEARKGGQV
jgi:protein arginine N-methyltransferase 2